MNDEFLHALRRDPPPEFARALKRRLQRLPARRSVWSSVVRTMLAMVLIGGVAMAAALLLRGRDELKREAPPIVQAPAPKEPAPATQPIRTPEPASRVANNPSATPEPEAQQAGAMGELAPMVATSALTQPIAEALADRLRNDGSYAVPQPRIMEAADAFRGLCEGIGFVFASRRIEQAESARCTQFRTEIVEWHIGYQAVVLTAGPTVEPAALTAREVFLALARRIPDPADPSRLIDNPNSTWHDVDARLDYGGIDVLVPADPGTRASLLQLLMEPGCETYPWISSLRQTDRRRFDDICHQVRSDGRYREVQLTERLVTQQLLAEPNWLIVLNYSYYDKYRAQRLSSMLEGPAPTLASLADGTYAAARPVYVYAQRRQFEWNRSADRLARSLTDEYTLQYLANHGLVRVDEVERRKQREEHSR